MPTLTTSAPDSQGREDYSQSLERIVIVYEQGEQAWVLVMGSDPHE